MDLPITVVVPTYNRLENLRRTLAGLARQDIDPKLFEVVVVSDGSTDGTDTWLQGAACDYPFSLRPVRQDNAGPATARNRGIEEARGEVVGGGRRGEGAERQERRGHPGKLARRPPRGRRSYRS